MAAVGKVQDSQVAGMMNNFRKQVNGIEGVSASQVRLKTTTASLTEEIAKQEFTFKKMASMMKSGTLGNAIKSIAAEQMALKNAMVIPEAESRLSGKGAYTVVMAEEAGNAAAKATMEYGVFNDMVRSSSENLLKWGKNTQWAGRQLSMGLTLPIIAAAAATGALAFKLNEAQARFKAVYGDLSTSPTELNDALAATNKTATEMASTFGVVGHNTVSLAADFAAAGYKGQELQAITAQTTKIMTIGEVDQQTAMQATISMLSTFKMNANQLTDAFNHMNAVENQTVLTTNDMVQAIPRVAPIIANLHGSYQDMLVLMTAMKAGGIDAVGGATGLSRALTSLISPSSKASTELAALGINIDNLFKQNTDAQGNRNLVGIFNDLGTAIDSKLGPNGAQKVIVDLFGKFQDPRITAMLSNLIDGTGKVGDQVKSAMNAVNLSTTDAAAVTDREIKQRMGSTSGEIKRVWAEIQTELANGGQSFLVFGEIALKVLNDIIKIFSSLPGPVKKTVEVMLGIGAMVGPIIMLTGLFANFTAQLLKGFTVVGAWITKTKVMTAEQRLQDTIAKEQLASFELQQASIEKLTFTMQELITKYMQLGTTAARAGGEVAAASEMMNLGGRNYGSTASGLLVPQGALQTAEQEAESTAVVAANTKAVGQATGENAGKTRMFNSTLSKTVGMVTSIGTGIMLWDSGFKGIPGDIAKIGGALLILVPVIKMLGALVRKALGAEAVAAVSGLIRSKLGIGATGGILKGIGGKLLGRVGVGGAAAGAGESLGLTAGLSSVGAAIGTTGLMATGVGAVAIGGIAAGVYLWHKHNQQVIKDQLEIIDNSKALTEDVGGSWKAATGWAMNYDKALTTVGDTTHILNDQTNKWKEDSAASFGVLKDALKNRGDAGVTDWVQNQTQQMYLNGQNMKTVEKTVQVMLHSIGKDNLLGTIDINPKIDLGKASITQAHNAAIKLTDALGEGFSGSNDTVRNAIADMLGHFNVPDKTKKDFVATVVAPYTSARDAALKQIESLGPDATKAILKYGPTVGEALDNLISGRATIHAGRSQGVENSIKAIAAGLQNGKKNADALIATIAKLEGIQGVGGKPITTLGDWNYYLAHTSDEAHHKVDDLGNSMDKAATKAEIMASKVAMLKKNITNFTSDLQNNIASQFSSFIDAGLTNFDNLTAAGDTAIERQQKAAERHLSDQQKATDRHYNNLIRETSTSNDKMYQSTKDSYDGRISEIKKAMKAESAAEAERQRNYEAEKQRLADMAANQNAAFQYNQDLAGGNLSQAAIDAANAISQSQQQVLDEANQAQADKAARDQADNQKRIDRLTRERDTALKSIKAQEEARRKALEKEKAQADKAYAHQKALLDKQYQDQKTAYDDQRALLRDHLSTELNMEASAAATSKKKYDAILAGLNSDLATYGANIVKGSMQWSDTVAGGWSKATHDAVKQVQADAEWTKLGKEMQRRVTKGALDGMNWKQFVHWVTTGHKPKSLGGDSSNNSDAPGNHRKTAAHSGEYIKGDGRFENGKQPNETDRRLLHGEYVIRKPSVDRYGTNFMEALNNGMLPKMHSGGEVGPGMVGAVVGGAAYMLQQALEETIIGAATRRDEKNVSHGQPSIFSSGGGSMTKREGDLIAFAKTLLGIPYVWGGTTPLGFDCSGFTEYVYQHALGMTIPRTSQQQWAASRHIKAQNAQAGDLLFTEMASDGPHHVMLYMGNDKVIEAPHTGVNVMVEDFNPVNAAGVGRFLKSNRIRGTSGGSYGAADGTGRGPHPLTAFIPAIKTALSTAHLPTTSEYVQGVLHRIGIEDASGIKGEVNRNDSNWVAGTPSVGLMQVIKPTFEDNAGPYRHTGPFSYGVSTNPTANIYAGIEHAIHAYSKPFLDVMYQTGGYDNGGWIKPGFNGIINKTGVPEPVFNPAQWDLLKKSVAQNMGGAGGGNTYTIDVQVTDANASPELIARRVMNEIKKSEGAQGRNRKIG